MKVALNPHELGMLVRAEREARGLTQSWVAERVGCRRQTIADLEAGRNVSSHTLMSMLMALGKGLAVVDARVDFERLTEIFRDDEDEA